MRLPLAGVVAQHVGTPARTLGSTSLHWVIAATTGLAGMGFGLRDDLHSDLRSRRAASVVSPSSTRPIPSTAILFAASPASGLSDSLRSPPSDHADTPGCWAVIDFPHWLDRPQLPRTGVGPAMLSSARPRESPIRPCTLSWSTRQRGAARPHAGAVQRRLQPRRLEQRLHLRLVAESLGYRTMFTLAALTPIAAAAVCLVGTRATAKAEPTRTPSGRHRFACGSGTVVS